MATPDFRHITVTEYRVPVKARDKLDQLTPLSTINDIPVQDSPNQRLGNKVNLLNLWIYMTYKYTGALTTKFLNIYLIKKNQKESVTDPDPTLNKIVETINKTYDGTVIPEQVPATTMMKINSSVSYEILASRTICFVPQNPGAYEELYFDFRSLECTYSNENITSAQDAIQLKKALSNNVYLYACSDGETINNQEGTFVELEYTYRLTYTP